jgi:hypothetical protein
MLPVSGAASTKSTFALTGRNPAILNSVEVPGRGSEPVKSPVSMSRSVRSVVGPSATSEFVFAMCDVPWAS